MSMARWLGLPEPVQTALLLLTIALTLAPWFAGVTIGNVQIPKLDPRRRRALRVSGPILLLLALVLVFPLPSHPTQLHLLAADVLDNGEIDVAVSNTGNSAALLTAIELEVVRDHGIAARSMLPAAATYRISIDDLAPGKRRRLVIRHLIAAGATERITIDPETTRAVRVRVSLRAADGAVLQTVLELLADRRSS